MWIIVENGDVFEGDEEQLDECFGLTQDRPIPVSLIYEWADSFGYKVEIRFSNKQEENNGL